MCQVIIIGVEGFVVITGSQAYCRATFDAFVPEPAQVSQAFLYIRGTLSGVK